MGKRRGAGTQSGESPESVGKQNMSGELGDVVGSANKQFPGLRERPGVSMGISITYKDRKSIKRTKGLLFELLNKRGVETIYVLGRMRTPSHTKHTLLISTRTFTPKDAKMNESCITDTFRS